MMLGSTARQTLENMVVSFLAFIVGVHFTSLFHGASSAIGGLWVVISGLVVLQSTRHKTLSSAWLRVLGSLIGAIVSGAYLWVLPFSALGMAVCIGLTVLLCQLMGVPDHARLAGITVSVVMVASSLSPSLSPVLNAFLRFVESSIGTAIAVAVAYLPTHSP